MKKIAFVARTVGLDYDDRIRKEAITLSENYEVKIFTLFESNIESKGITSYGIPYQSFSLKSRNWFKSGGSLLVKAFDFYLSIRNHLKEYDLVWCHEEYTFVFPLLLKNKNIIWDLHELPARFENGIMKKVFKYIEVRCKYIIHANEQRLNYLKTKELVTQISKHKIVNNYPDEVFFQSKEQSDIYKEFLKWLNGEDYIYLQGLSVAERYPYNTISSILEETSYKIVVIGGFYDKASKQKLKNNFGEIINKRVFFTGKVKQLEIPQFLNKSKFTLIFYNTDNPNSRYCEANRFYQAINLGVPVITGKNETMSTLVDKLQLGVSLKSDGRDIDEIKLAIKTMEKRYEVLKKGCEDNSSIFVWKKENIDYKLFYKI